MALLLSYISSRTSTRRLLKPCFSSLYLFNNSTLTGTSVFPLKSPNPDTNTAIPKFDQFTPFYNFGFHYQSVFPNLRFAQGFSTLPRSEDENEENRKPGVSSKAQEVSWIDLWLPRNARPYARLARLDKPIGTWLLAWPCMWYALHFFLFFLFTSNLNSFARK